MANKKWKPAKGKTWKQKLLAEHPSHGKIVNAAKGAQTMVIPRPRDVDAAMRRIRKGSVKTLSHLRSVLAAKAGTDIACPLCTGIFTRIAAEAAEEDRREGVKRITPYWRTVRDDGSMIDKFPGGAGKQAAMLRKEGVTLVPGRPGKSPRVRALVEK